MKLTNTMRDTFVAAVMEDVPSIDYAHQIEGLVRRLAFEQFPAFIKGAVGHSHGFLRHEFMDAHGSKYFVPAPPGFDLEEIRRETEALAHKRDSQRMQRAELRARLLNLANTCTTVGALADSVPELASYTPDGPGEQLSLVERPRSNVVESLKLGGWKAKA